MIDSCSKACNNVCHYLFNTQTSFCLTSLFPFASYAARSSLEVQSSSLSGRSIDPYGMPKKVSVCNQRARTQQVYEKSLKNSKIQFIFKAGSLPTQALCDGQWKKIDSMAGKSLDGSLIGAATCEGCCHANEDTFMLSDLQFISGGKLQTAKVLAVFDGHRGTSTSQFLKKYTCDFLSKSLEKSCVKDLTDEGIVIALENCFKSLDQAYSGRDGSTATLAFIINKKVWVANVGDSRAVLVNEKETIQLSEDAIPGLPYYRTQIEQRGGKVTQDNDGTYRINYRLSMARVIGDHDFVSATSQAEVTCYPIKEKNSYIVIASDGLTEIATSNEIGKAVQCMHSSGEHPRTMAHRLVYSVMPEENNLSGWNHSWDNVTVVVAKLS